MKLKTRSFFRSSSKGGGRGTREAAGGAGEIKWELRPGGMLVQKREDNGVEEMIRVRVSNGIKVHQVSVKDTSTFR